MTAKSDSSAPSGKGTPPASGSPSGTEAPDPVAHTENRTHEPSKDTGQQPMAPKGPEAQEDAAQKAAAEEARKAGKGQAKAPTPNLPTPHVGNQTVVNIQAGQPGFLAARRRQRTKRVMTVYMLLVGLPTLLAGLYYGAIASDMYISEAKLTVRDASAPRLGGLETVLASSFGSNPSQNIQMVAEYFESREAVDRLDALLDLGTLYADPEADPLSRLSANASREDLTAYWRDITQFNLDETAGTLTMQVRAFHPNHAKLVAETLIQLGDDLVSSIADSARTDAVAFARKEVNAAEARLKQATAAINDFQIARGQIDPGRSASDALGIIAELEGQLASARAELAQQSTYMRSDSAAVAALRARVAALQGQVEEQRRRLTDKGGQYPQLLGEFQRLKTEFELAEKGYVSAVASLEGARVQAQQKQIYLIPFVPPSEPTEAEYPRPYFTTLSVFLGANLLLGILALMVAAVREHGST